MTTAIGIVALMGLIGLIFGYVLAYANKRFAVELNPLIHAVEEELPKGQCGACGFAGCQAYAEAVVMDSSVAPNLCTPGKAEVARRVAELTGKEAKEVDGRVAFVKCANPISIAKKKFEYSGIQDCIGANILHSGPKDCKYGCIGFGTCERSCPFNAIKINEKGLPVVDVNMCTGCGKCKTACPKKIIDIIPVNTYVGVACSSKEKGAIVRKSCNVACLACGLCKKQCPHGAIVIENNLAVVNEAVCLEKCKNKVCLEKCPTGAIRVI